MKGNIAKISNARVISKSISTFSLSLYSFLELTQTITKVPVHRKSSQFRVKYGCDDFARLANYSRLQDSLRPIILFAHFPRKLGA